MDRAAGGGFTVTCNSEDGNMHADFSCPSEMHARDLRNAIRACADKLRSVADYRRDAPLPTLEAALFALGRAGGNVAGSPYRPAWELVQAALAAMPLVGTPGA